MRNLNGKYSTVSVVSMELICETQDNLKYSRSPALWELYETSCLGLTPGPTKEKTTSTEIDSEQKMQTGEGDSRLQEPVFIAIKEELHDEDVEENLGPVVYAEGFLTSTGTSPRDGNRGAAKSYDVGSVPSDHHAEVQFCSQGSEVDNPMQWKDEFCESSREKEDDFANGCFPTQLLPSSDENDEREAAVCEAEALMAAESESGDAERHLLSEQNDDVACTESSSLGTTPSKEHKALDLRLEGRIDAVKMSDEELAAASQLEHNETSALETRKAEKLEQSALKLPTKERGRPSKCTGPFCCVMCGKCFPCPSRLEAHMRAHTGERPFRCFACEKAFTTEDQLIVHVRVHTKEKPFHCADCGKTFSQSGNLGRHMRRHSDEKPLKCELCGKGFKDTTSLSGHKRTHSDERPYKCSECGKAFKESGKLTTHMRTHTGERPFVCIECGRGFNHSSHLSRHKRLVHTSASIAPEEQSS